MTNLVVLITRPPDLPQLFAHQEPGVDQLADVVICTVLPAEEVRGGVVELCIEHLTAEVTVDLPEFFCIGVELARCDSALAALISLLTAHSLAAHLCLDRVDKLQEIEELEGVCADLAGIFVLLE